MNSEELRVSLQRETVAKNQSVESAKLALTNAAENFRKELSESAQNYRADLRDEMKKAREDWEKTTQAERQRWAATTRGAELRLVETRKKMWIWGPVALLTVALVTAAITATLSWVSVSRGTGTALNSLQQTEAIKLADLRGQVETANNALKSAQSSLTELRRTIAEEERRLTETQAKMEDYKRLSELTTFHGKNGEVFVEILPTAKAFDWEGRTIIAAKKNK